MTDTTFFIPTKAAFEHAFEVGAFAEADADDWMYMHSDVAEPVGWWSDHFKHRDTRKYTKVRRFRFIGRADPHREDGTAGPETAGQKAVEGFDTAMEAHAAEAAALVIMLVETLASLAQDLEHAGEILVTDDKRLDLIYAALKAAGWKPGEED